MLSKSKNLSRHLFRVQLLVFLQVVWHVNVPRKELNCERDEVSRLLLHSSVKNLHNDEPGLPISLVEAEERCPDVVSHKRKIYKARAKQMFIFQQPRLNDGTNAFERVLLCMEFSTFI
ncbi:hypothetical protein M758_6G179600 [Ceratodon purpureus]|nr:hypothetical protein M758_6G179600 [Ceratodon purpureus]